MMATSGRKRPMSLAEEQVRRGLSQLTVKSAPAAAGTLPHVLATTGPHTGELPLIDLEAAVQGELIARGVADWEALAVGAAGQALLSGGAAANVSWGAPAPAAHEGTHVQGGADDIDAALDARTLGFTEQGDIVFRAAGANTLGVLPHGAANEALLSGGHGADPSWGAPAIGAHGVAQHTDITRERFIPMINDFHANASLDNFSYHSSILCSDAVVTMIYLTFRVPSDFVSFGSIKLVWGAGIAAGNMRWKLDAMYAAAGEANNTHTDTPGYGETAIAGLLFINEQEPALPLAMAALALGDVIGIQFAREASHANDTLNGPIEALGLLFTYTANQ